MAEQNDKKEKRPTQPGETGHSGRAYHDEEYADELADLPADSAIGLAFTSSELETNAELASLDDAAMAAIDSDIFPEEEGLSPGEDAAVSAATAVNPESPGAMPSQAGTHNEDYTSDWGIYGSRQQSGEQEAASFLRLTGGSFASLLRPAQPNKTEDEQKAEDEDQS